MSRLAYTAYALGSGVFLAVAVERGQPLLAAGSGLFLLGTLALLVGGVRSRAPGGRPRS